MGIPPAIIPASGPPGFPGSSFWGFGGFGGIGCFFLPRVRTKGTAKSMPNTKDEKAVIKTGNWDIVLNPKEISQLLPKFKMINVRKTTKIRINPIKRTMDHSSILMYGITPR
jgi:hypothetical protein